MSRHNVPTFMITVFVAALVAAGGVATSGPSTAQVNSSRDAVAADKIGDDSLAAPAPGTRRFLVETTTIAAARRAVTAADNSRVPLRGPVFHGSVITTTPAQARRLSHSPGVVSVTPDEPIALDSSGQGDKTGSPESTPAAVKPDGGTAVAVSSWGLDRTDQIRLPLNGQYLAPGSGSGVQAFVIDTGIDLDHPEFAGRIGQGAYVYTGVDDCVGHGTHVSGTIASSRYGMARAATLHPVNIFGCASYYYNSNLLAGLNWVAGWVNSHPGTHAVLNMSLGGSYNATVNSAVADLADLGVVIVSAAGNDSANACDVSPASSVGTLTVGAADRNDSDTDFSNYGPCLDLYAPGKDILSTDYADHNLGIWMSGTSMATPHVTGAAAAFWSRYPGRTATQVKALIASRATPNLLTFPWGQAGSPNRLLNVDLPTGAPTHLKAVGGPRSATLTWGQPADRGNPTATPLLQQRLGTGAWTTIPARAAITGLQPGRHYQFRIAFRNLVGTSAFVTSNIVTPFGPPKAPGTVHGTISSQGNAVLAWQAPTGPVTSYSLKIKRTTWKTLATTTTPKWSGKISNVHSGTRVTLAVTATNRAGTSPMSAATVIRAQ
ncbi:MAG: S8 family serine peptidase [Candidatus Nanopelagicales bacterium]